MTAAERLHPNPLKLPSRKQQRLLVKKRNSRIVYLLQGVTRMNVYLRDQPCLLQKLKPSYPLHRIGAQQSLLMNSLNLYLPRRTLIPHAMKYPHRGSMVIPSGLASALPGRPPLWNHPVVPLFLNLPGQLPWISRLLNPSLRVRQPNRHHSLPIPFPVRQSTLNGTLLLLL